MENEKRPIKKVAFIDQDRYPKQLPKGMNYKFFHDVTPKFRENLCDQLSGIEQALSREFEQWPELQGLAVVSLHDDALAKSHRPNKVFNDKTCPIVGDIGFGEVLIQINKNRLRNLRHRIIKADGESVISQLSTINHIRYYSEKDKLHIPEDYDLKQAVTLRLFNFHNDDINDKTAHYFRLLLKTYNIELLKQYNFSLRKNVYKLKVKNREQVDALVGYLGTQSLSINPSVFPLKRQAVPLKELEDQELVFPDNDTDYPVVGLIDSGVSALHPWLPQWVSATEKFIPDDLVTPQHGSFVAGLLIQPRRFNHNDGRFPSGHCKVVDVQFLSDNVDVGFFDLMETLNVVIPKHPEVRVWNLSLGTEFSADEFVISEIGADLDVLQDKYGVVFVISSGNYVETPFRSWPSNLTHDRDRVSAPGDSTRGLTVGSVAHLDRPGVLVKSDEPSPFSRRGPGPSYIVKPEVVHYGGNCSDDGSYLQTGILSINENGYLAEDIGTSFSTPLVTNIISNLIHDVDKGMSSEMARALVIHSAVIRNNRFDEEDVKYYGWGVPGDVEDIISDDSYTATLAFEGELDAQMDLHKVPFPIPDCFRMGDDRVQGEFIATLVYNPPLDPNYKAEYCRTNIELSLGEYDEGQKGKVKIKPDKKKETRTEKELVEHGFKWAPVKVFRQNFPRGTKGDVWRLHLNLKRRDGEPPVSQRFALVLTLRDPKQEKDVYNDMIQAMNKIGWHVSNIREEEHVRERL